MPCGGFYRQIVGVGIVYDFGNIARALARSWKTEIVKVSKIAVLAYYIKTTAMLRNTELVGRKNFTLYVVVKSSFFNRVAKRMIDFVPRSSLVVAF